MKKYAQIIDEQTKECTVGLGCNYDYYKAIGLEELDVEQAQNGRWYLTGYLPIPTQEEQEDLRKRAYLLEVDPITAHISRLKDLEQTQEILEEIANLQAEREVKVADIKARYPYPNFND